MLAGAIGQPRRRRILRTDGAKGGPSGHSPKWDGAPVCFTGTPERRGVEITCHTPHLDQSEIVRSARRDRRLSIRRVARPRPVADCCASTCGAREPARRLHTNLTPEKHVDD